MHGRPQSRDAFTLEGEDQMVEQTLRNVFRKCDEKAISAEKKASEEGCYDPCKGTVNLIMIDGMVVITYTCPISTNIGCFSTIQKYGAALCEPIKVARYSHKDETLIAYNEGCRCMQ